MTSSTTKPHRNGAHRGTITETVCVAIYTRQSVADDAEFNSLDAQREAVQAYVQSQRGQGWTALSKRYDDHGFSGATTKRPAFERLLQDIQAGDVDVVAVYKIDRLSRSLLDFTRLMEMFQRHGVTFVSVTQHFSTTDSVGRMTLNLLATFAQFERETIAERTRDKMGAARRRGLWTGGRVVLGYDLRDKRLVVNEEEAERVRETFKLYLQHESLLATARDLNQRGWKTKSWTNKKGETVPGYRISKNNLRALLTNPIYRGQIRYREETHDGQHEAIVDTDLWVAVQARLGHNSVAQRNKWNVLLQGLVVCGVCGNRMGHHFAKRGNRRYGAYVCQKAQKEGAKACPGSRIPCAKLESFVVEHVRAIGRNPELFQATLEAARNADSERKPALVDELQALRQRIRESARERHNLVDALANDATGAETVQKRIAELDETITELEKRAAQLQTDIDAIDQTTVDEEELRTALEQFTPIWDELFPTEQIRLLKLLLEEVKYTGSTGQVEIRFRDGDLLPQDSTTKCPGLRSAAD